MQFLNEDFDSLYNRGDGWVVEWECVMLIHNSIPKLSISIINKKIFHN